MAIRAWGLRKGFFGFVATALAISAFSGCSSSSDDGSPEAPAAGASSGCLIGSCTMSNSSQSCATACKNVTWPEDDDEPFQVTGEVIGNCSYEGSVGDCYCARDMNLLDEWDERNSHCGG